MAGTFQTLNFRSRSSILHLNSYFLRYRVPFCAQSFYFLRSQAIPRLKHGLFVGSIRDAAELDPISDGAQRQSGVYSSGYMEKRPQPLQKFAANNVPSGMTKSVPVILLVVIAALFRQSIRPPPPKTCGSPGGPPVTAPRVKLRDGRYLAYKESGVPKENAKFKIIFVHPFDCCRHDVVVATHLPKEMIEELGVYVVSFDRPGYGESDPDPKRTMKSTAMDVEELADHLGLGDKFYVIGLSMGGQTVWGTLKYIPHRLAGAALLAPVVNYWWRGFPANISKEAFQKQLPQDQWTLRVSHYLPWLTYWWNVQKFFPASSVAANKPDNFNRQDLELFPKIIPLSMNHKAQVRQQGEHESIHRDMIIGFGSWEFSPLELKNPFPNNKGSVHLWQGDEDGLVPVTLQRYIAKSLPWIQYHELPGAGHMFPFVDGMVEVILKALLLGEK